MWFGRSVKITFEKFTHEIKHLLTTMEKNCIGSIMENPTGCTSSAEKCHERVSGHQHSTKDDKEIVSFPPHKELSKRQRKNLLKRKKKAEQKKYDYSEVKKQKLGPESIGFTADLFKDTDYYFENGLRKVYPYYFSFTSYAKRRWVGSTVLDVYNREFRGDKEDHEASMEAGNITVNGQHVSRDYMLKDNDFVSHTLHRHENPVSAQPIEMLHLDDDVVVINKPSSIPCHPCGKYRFNSVVFILGKELGLTQLRNIYRLDRLTSGVLIMGRTNAKTRQLEAEVADRKVQKEYVCRVVGLFPEGTTEVNQPLSCISHKLCLFRVDQEGKPSHTSFERLSYNGQSSVVRCRPHTGRTHQIRVHLQFLGYPIVNDPLYNTDAWGPSRCKGGVLEKTLEELQEAIRAEHHVGRYIDANDPKYQEIFPTTCSASTTTTATRTPTTHGQSNSVSVCETMKPVATRNDKDGEKIQEPSAKVDDQELAELSTSTKHSGEATDAIETTNINVTETVKNHINIQDLSKTMEHDNMDTCQLKTVENDEKVTEHIEDEPNVNPSTSNELGISMVHQNIATIANELGFTTVHQNTPNINTSASNEQGTTPDNLNLPDYNDKRVQINQPPLDPSKLTTDANCFMCQRRYINPQPKDLVMYLHALRYKGTDWEYSTELPEWAKSDWMLD